MVAQRRFEPVKDVRAAPIAEANGLASEREGLAGDQEHLVLECPAMGVFTDQQYAVWAVQLA